MERIVKNDTVKVISGNYKGKTGRVIKVLPDKDRVIVEKIQLVKRHTRPRSQQQQQSGIIEKEASIHISNVMLVCPKCGKPSRTHSGTLSGKKVRVCNSCEEMLTGE